MSPQFSHLQDKNDAIWNPGTGQRKMKKPEKGKYTMHTQGLTQNE